jgi:hypothetical protein
MYDLSVLHNRSTALVTVDEDSGPNHEAGWSVPELQASFPRLSNPRTFSLGLQRIAAEIASEAQRDLISFIANASSTKHASSVMIDYECAASH